MAVIIKTVDIDSIAYNLGIKAFDVLVSINGHNIKDVLDYRFYETEQDLSLKILRDEKELTFEFKKTRYSSIGLDFETYLMDKEKSCKNKCIFCFIDQLPKGMRESIYFKDDDERLSFFFGNYVTLTNMMDEDVDRIIQMHISPINISVHTMNPELRCKMMNNRFAGEKLSYLNKLAESGISINAQLVLCPDINDGDELRFSLEQLSSFGDNLQSVACVPVGLTAHRDGLFPLEAFTSEKAKNVIDIIQEFGDKSIKDVGFRRFFPSDEFYIIAKQELPDFDFYEDFPQIENGVGMFRNLEEELIFALEEAEDVVNPCSVSIITGTAIYPLLNCLLDEVRKKWDNVNVQLIPVENHFFGGGVDVTGLLTGSDIIGKLKNENLNPWLLVPDVTLKADEDIFLDDISLDMLAEKLDVKVKKFGATGQDLLDAILGSTIN